ncbi:MAG: FemAB family XrtA/PEP-CTERM system-associated protein, partial [Gemmatimonadales bacterium]
GLRGRLMEVPNVRIIEASAGDRGRWNAFALDAPAASVFHRYEWREVIARAYGHEAHYLLAEEADRVAGVLPLVFIRSRLFGRALVSLPFADYGGIVAVSAPVTRALLERALALGREHRAEYLQLRHREPVAEVEGVPGDKLTMLLALEHDPRGIWDRLPSERRNRIRKADRAGLAGRVVGAEEFEPFYRVLAENMRDIGSPVHSRAFFLAVLDALGPSASVVLVEREGEAIGAALVLGFGDTVVVPWVSSLRRHFRLNPNMVLYWTAIEHACRAGYRTLDFGRSSPGTGTFEFKRQWGAVPHPLAWSSFPLTGHGVPTFSGEGLKERLMVECWKRLPIWVSTRLGPRLRGLIPA